MGAKNPESTFKDEKEFEDELPANSQDESAENAEEEFADTVIWENNKQLTEIGEGSVQIDVESLVAEFEAEASSGVDANGRIRKRLEAIAERKRRHEELMDFEDYDID